MLPSDRAELPPAAILPCSYLISQSSWRAQVSLLSGSAIPSCRWFPPAPGFFLCTPLPDLSLNNRQHPLSDLGSAPESCSECIQSCPLRQDTLSRGSAPYSTFNAATPFFCPPFRPRTVPPPGFGYPPGGSGVASPSPVYFAGTALVGFRPSKGSLPADSIRLSAGRCPLNGSPPRSARTRQCSPRRRRFLGFDPGRNPLLRESTIKCFPRPFLPWASSSPRTSSTCDDLAFARSPFSSLARFAAKPIHQLLPKVSIAV